MIAIAGFVGVLREVLPGVLNRLSDVVTRHDSTPLTCPVL
jgi:hypothetical protein